MQHWTENWHVGFMWVLLAVLLMGALLAILRLLANAAARRIESPKEILRRRYAAGEIDEETYKHMLGQLSDRSPAQGDERQE